VIERGAIVIRGIQFQASHGASAEERRRTRRFEVDVDIEATPVIARAGQVCAIAIRAGTEATCHLVERVAERILEAIAARHPDATVTVEVRKLDPPCPGSPRACGVRVERGPRPAPA
jgi:dihydroneopterin aldolase